MGGVDLLDRALSDLRPVIREKKWYYPLVKNAISIAFIYSCHCIVSFLMKSYHRKISENTLWVSWSDNQSPSSSILIHVQQWLMKWDMMGHYPISCPVRKYSLCGKSCRNSCEKCKRSLRVKTYFQIFHVTIRWHCYHNMCYIHYLKMFCNYCHINKQRILSIPNVFLTCQPQAI